MWEGDITHNFALLCCVCFHLDSRNGYVPQHFAWEIKTMTSIGLHVSLQSPAGRVIAGSNREINRWRTRCLNSVGCRLTLDEIFGLKRDWFILISWLHPWSDWSLDNVRKHEFQNNAPKAEKESQPTELSAAESRLFLIFCRSCNFNYYYYYYKSYACTCMIVIFTTNLL